MKRSKKLWRLFLPIFVPVAALSACIPLEPRQIDVLNTTDFVVECTVWLNAGFEEPDAFPIDGFIYPGETGTHGLSELEIQDSAGGDENPHEKSFFVACTSMVECDEPDAVDGLCARETRESAPEPMEPTDCEVVGTVDDPGVVCMSLTDKRNEFESEHSG